MAKEGTNLLKLVEAEVQEQNLAKVKSILTKTVTKKKERETWIRNRTDQVNQITNLQKEIVKALDEGTLTDAMLEEFERKLVKISNQSASKGRGNDQEDWD